MAKKTPASEEAGYNSPDNFENLNVPDNFC